jgi:energy-coupling factor transporter ATP-binding protein EcfA2
MIRSVKFTSGYPLDIKSEQSGRYCLRDKTITFNEGINVLFAPNGTGKSTILNAISIYGLTEGGWSNLHFHAMNFYEEGRERKYSINTLATDKYKFTAEVDIDGPVFKLIGVTRNQFEDGHENCGFGDGLFNSTEALVQKMYKSQRSQGQRTLYEQGTHLVAFLDDYDKYKFNEENFKEPTTKEKNDIWKRMYRALYKYSEGTILKGGKPTLILDEPELHLDLDHTLGLYTNIIPKLAEHFQIILSSHFCLLPFFKEYSFVNWGYKSEVLCDYIKKVIKTEEEG